MSDVKQFRKWNLRTGEWIKVGAGDERKMRALSYVEYPEIIHNKSAAIDYILIADGCRVDNHSKDGTTVSDRKAGIKNALRYFENKPGNYRIMLLLVDNDAPLVEQSRALASTVDFIACHDFVRTVNFIGFSKCGAIALDMAKYLTTMDARFKTRLYSVSAPYTGALIAGPLLFEKEIVSYVKAKMGDTPMSEKVIKSVMEYYYNHHSRSHMELDISPREGVPKGFIPVYDSSFLQNIFSDENLKGVDSVAHYQNICTKIEEETFATTMKAGAFDQIRMFVFNDILYKGESDGLVHIDSQRAIEKHLPKLGESLLIPSTHHVLKTPVYANQLLDVVDENMGAKRLALH